MNDPIITQYGYDQITVYPNGTTVIHRVGS